MTIIIELYIIICMALLLFNLAFLVIKNSRTHALYPKNTAFEASIRFALEYWQVYGTLPGEFCHSLHHKLHRIRNLITLVNVMQENESRKSLFAPYIFALIDDYSEKKASEKAYYAYVVSLLDYDETKIPLGFSGKFIEFLSSKSLYVFSNTMNALYHFGQPHLLSQALDAVDQRGAFYHKKLLIDGLLSARVDYSVFNPMVLERFDRYHPYLQESLLDFFRMNNWDVSALCMRLMQDPKTDPQVRYTAMRYFAKFPCEDSDAFFLRVLQASNSPWLEQMLAIQGLAHNSSLQVRIAIEAKITSSDWYVRLNAAEYMQQHHLTQQDIDDILSLQDRYSTEILRYCCRNDKELTNYIDACLLRMEQEEQERQRALAEASELSCSIISEVAI